MVEVEFSDSGGAPLELDLGELGTGSVLEFGLKSGTSNEKARKWE